MNNHLYRQMMKSNMKSILGFGIGSGLYILLIISIYPSFANSAEFQQLLDMYPESLLTAFGIEGLSELTDFLSGQYYGMLYLLLLSIFSIVTAAKLLARYVSQGSMSYLLATPLSRTTIALTQALVLISSLFLITAFATAFTFLGQFVSLDEPVIKTGSFLTMNVTGLLLFVAISSYCFFFSAVCSDDKKAVGMSALITISMYAFDLVGKLSVDFEWMRHLSLFSLFNPSEIARGDATAGGEILLFTTIAIIFYTAAIICFKKRDLPL